MTTVVAEAPDKKAQAAADKARAERGRQIAEKLLAGHVSKADQRPVTARAFGQALAATEPGSEHGQLLAAALRARPWSDRPEAERAVLLLARRGDTPTAPAVQAFLEGAARRRERGRRMRVQAEACVEADGVRAAVYVAEVVRDTGAGPTWHELQAAMGWPRQPYALRGIIVRGLVTAGWLTAGTAPRSLRPGPAAARLAQDEK